MVSQLVLAFKLFLTNLTIELTLTLFLLSSIVAFVMRCRDVVHFILFAIVFFNLSESLFLKPFLHFFHFLFFSFLLLLALKFLLCLLLFLLSAFGDVGNETRVSLAHIRQ